MTRAMRIPNMCLLKLDNGKVVSIANEHNYRQTDRITITEPSSTVLVYRYYFFGKFICRRIWPPENLVLENLFTHIFFRLSSLLWFFEDFFFQVIIIGMTFCWCSSFFRLCPYCRAGGMLFSSINFPSKREKISRLKMKKL